MSVTEQQFTSDLNELRIIGKMDLPMLALIHAKVNNAVASTSGVDSAAFETSAGGPSSRITDIWRDLRDELQTILGRSAKNLETAGHTICHIADTYAIADGFARDALRSAWRDGTPPLTAAGEHIPTEQLPALNVPKP